jgi:hypothetical protein
VVEYGQPIYVDPATLKDYKAGGSEVRLDYSRILTVRVLALLLSLLLTNLVSTSAETRGL